MEIAIGNNVMNGSASATATLESLVTEPKKIKKKKHKKKDRLSPASELKVVDRTSEISWLLLLLSISEFIIAAKQGEKRDPKAVQVIDILQPHPDRLTNEWGSSGASVQGSLW